MRNLIICSLVLASFSSCNYRREKNADLNGGSPAPIDSLRGSQIGYAQIQASIFGPSCNSCHSGGQSPNLTNYAEVKSSLDQIYTEVIVNKTMPKRGPLPADQMEYLKSWIDAGAPEFGKSTDNAPVQDPPIFARPIKWNVLKANLVEPKCASCHYAGNPDATSDFTDYETFKNTSDTIIFLTITNIVMPPPPAGTPEDAPNPNALSKAEQELLSNWVADGMLF